MVIHEINWNGGYELQSFFEDRIIKNRTNSLLKEHENKVFKEILMLLDDTKPLEAIDWTYFAPFDGFKKLMTEMNIRISWKKTRRH